MKHKVDIFSILNGISHGDTNLIDSFSDDELKTVSPYVLQIWIKGADNNIDARMVLTNEAVNPYVFSLNNHTKLLYKLLCVANGYKVNTYYKFNKKKSTNNSKLVKLLMDYYKTNQKHAYDSLQLLSESDIVEIAEALGYDPKYIKDVKEEYKKL